MEPVVAVVVGVTALMVQISLLVHPGVQVSYSFRILHLYPVQFLVIQGGVMLVGVIQ
jgi:hypothetical protein